MLRPFTPTRCLLFLACVSCVLIFTLVPRYDLLEGPDVSQVAPRGIFDLPSSAPATSDAPSSSSPSSSAPSSSPTTSSPTTSAASTPSSQPPSSAPSASPTPSPTPTPTPTSTPPITPTSEPPTSSPTPTPSQASPTPAQTFLSSSASVGADGETSVVYFTVTRSESSSSASASSTAGADTSDDGNSSKGVSTSTIIGLSVAGGVALIGIVAFVIWKFTRKRFTDDFDDSEAIKWPELNTHGDSPHALPTNRAGAAGFETNSEVNLTRPDSRAGSFAQSAATSTVDLYAANAAHDPYAVPPLPHQNPNLPYRDDPAGGFYDPYSGPVPQTFADTDSVAGGEAIPMTQINRARSPAPPMGYDPGRASPGPQMAYNLPPQGAYYNEGGRGSPAPRAMSPGPAMALSGRASPGPQAAYGYGGGVAAPPGLHQGY